jgi:thiamine phosphate synthase YjbQ (UPF0047 family)
MNVDYNSSCGSYSCAYTRDWLVRLHTTVCLIINQDTRDLLTHLMDHLDHLDQNSWLTPHTKTPKREKAEYTCSQTAPHLVGILHIQSRYSVSRIVLVHCRTAS